MKALIALLMTSSFAMAQTPAESAGELHRQGLEQMRAKDHAAAARSFAEAFKLDANPKYLFNLALAQRLGGDCRAAIESYRAYLATDAAANAANAKIGITKCEAILAASPQPPPDPPKPDAPKPDEPKPDEPKPQPKLEEAEPRIAEPPHTTSRDRFGTTLLVGSGVLGVTSITLLVLAHGAAKDTRESGPIGDYEDARDRAGFLQGASIVTGALAIGVGTWGVIRYIRRDARTTVGLTPTARGAALVVGGAW